MPYNLQPLEKLLGQEDPLELTRYLDKTLLALVQHSDNNGYIPDLGHWFYLLRCLGDALEQTVRAHGDS